jgi:hypothetical protein
MEGKKLLTDPDGKKKGASGVSIEEKGQEVAYVVSNLRLT